MQYFRKAQEEKSFRIYVTDALKAIAENGMHFVIPGHGAVDYGSAMSKRWADVIDPPKPVEVDDRPAKEIAADIWKRAGIGGERE